MIVKKKISQKLISALLGVFFAFIGIFIPINAYATPEDGTEVAPEATVVEAPEAAEITEPDDGKKTIMLKAGDMGSACQEIVQNPWAICSKIDDAANAVDYIYNAAQDLLDLDPIPMDDNSTTHAIWQFCLNITNLVFIIFIFVIVFSQVTGLGINNYGIKKALPKIIVAAIFVNLSYFICTVAVDASNIIGRSIKSFIEVGIPNAVRMEPIIVDARSIVSASVGGSVLGIFAAGSVESGSLYLLVPVLLAALAALVAAVVTIAIRQALVVLLVIISPLAIICHTLPNTEDLYRKWYNLFKKMLVFYPLISILFGAAQLAGCAIIAKAATDQNIFLILLGFAVQICPLFYSITMLKMSGTFLGNINSRVRGLFSRPLKSVTEWANLRKNRADARSLAHENVFMPTTRLRQFMTDRRYKLQDDTLRAQGAIKKRGEAYVANSHRREDGTPTRSGIESYEMQARLVQYEGDIAEDRNRMEGGLGQYVDAAKNPKLRAKLDAIDRFNVDASDRLAIKQAAFESIQKENIDSRDKRFQEAIQAHLDLEHMYEKGHKFHQLADRNAALNAYYNMLHETGVTDAMPALERSRRQQDTFLLAAANAAQSSASVDTIYQNKIGKLADRTVPTQDVQNITLDLAKRNDSSRNIDAIIAGMRTLNARGDTDLVLDTINEICRDGKLELGSYASQQLASFLMFEVKDNSPVLRRFGKYLNLETARVFNTKNDNPRYNRAVNYNEYILGEYDEYDVDENGNIRLDESGNPIMTKQKSKRSARILLEGTPLTGIERLAYKNITDSIHNAVESEMANATEEEKRKKEHEVSTGLFTAILPNFISARQGYASGSEQDFAAAEFTFGYKRKLVQKLDTATGEMGDEDQYLPTFDVSDNNERKKMIDRAKKYIVSQTAGQLQRFKSSDISALKQLLEDDARYENAQEEGETDDAYNERIASIASAAAIKMVPSDVYDDLLVNSLKGARTDSKDKFNKFFGLNNAEARIKVLAERNKLQNQARERAKQAASTSTSGTATGGTSTTAGSSSINSSSTNIPVNGTGDDEDIFDPLNPFDDFDDSPLSSQRNMNPSGDVSMFLARVDREINEHTNMTDISESPAYLNEVVDLMREDEFSTLFGSVGIYQFANSVDPSSQTPATIYLELRNFVASI